MKKEKLIDAILTIARKIGKYENYVYLSKNDDGVCPLPKPLELIILDEYVSDKYNTYSILEYAATRTIKRAYQKLRKEGVLCFD